MKIYSVEVQTDAGRRVVQLSAPLEVDTDQDMPGSFQSLMGMLWKLMQEAAAGRVPEPPKARA